MNRNQKYKIYLNVNLLLAVVTSPALAISASETPGFTITIHLYNYATVPDKTLAVAKEEVGRIFRKAGLTTLWVDHALSAGDLQRPHRSVDSWDGAHFVVRLLTQSSEWSSKNAMGEALSPEIANVFMNRVTKKAAVGEFSAGRMLGHAIAHEIGHCLLGNNSHASQGIMGAPWSKQDLRRISTGKLLFTRQEVTRIQTAASHRLKADKTVATAGNRCPRGKR